MTPDRRELAAVFVGGVVGALARYGLIELFEGGAHRGQQWPWAIFIANLLGALALGYFATRLQERLPLSAYRRPLLGTGFCGALTTFSTMQLELVRMFERGNAGLAVGYASASVIVGFAAVFAASGMVRRARLAT